MLKDRQIWQELYEEAPDAILLVDAMGAIKHANREAESLFGYAKNDLIGSPIEILIPERYNPKHVGLRNHYIANPHRRPMGAGLALAARRKDGTEIPVDIMLSPIHVSDEKLIICVIRDVTERRKAEEALKDFASELQRSNEELEQFAYVASHDLQEPLRSVASSCQFLERSLKGKLDQDTEEFLGFAIDGAKRMQDLISDLLAYSRVSRVLELRPVDISKVLDRVQANLSSQIQDTEAAIIRGNLPIIKGDFSLLTQLFQNLITNALKFRTDAKPVVTISADYVENELIFSISDNGIGIQNNNLEKIFDLFKRLHRHEKYPGTGIGLAICKKIIETHGGRIWVESVPGQGSTFKFTIPA